MRLTTNQRVWLVLIVLVVISFILGVAVGKYMHKEMQWELVGVAIKK